MTGLAVLCLGAYFTLLGLLTLYGGHRSFMLLRLKARPAAITSPRPPASLPRITVQLPIFNERYVVERLIDASCALDYPHELLEIQVLDDSTDATSALVARQVAVYRARGIRISHLKRKDRRGFKAGALEEGLHEATGTLIAVFDADFVPPRDFLLRCVGSFEDPGVGMVQARWGHLNPEYSGLTLAQAVLLDGHFQIEHASRHAAGHFFNFNGTAGIWRRQCIDEAGGWQQDTLTEDLDLSYRAQLRGWRFVYLPTVVAEAELPVEMTAFKSQQRRWAKGSIQTALKLLPRLLRSELSLGIKLDAFFHLSSNLCYLWTLLLTLLMPLATYARIRMGWQVLLWLDIPLFLLSIGSISFFYVEAMQDCVPSPRQRISWIPRVMGLGIGIGLNNATAVLEALLGYRTPFVRTPKHRIEGRRGVARGYHVAGGMQPWLELGIALYLLLGALYSVSQGWWASLPFQLLFMAGYLQVGLASTPLARVLSRLQPSSSA